MLRYTKEELKGLKVIVGGLQEDYQFDLICNVISSAIDTQDRNNVDMADFLEGDSDLVNVLKCPYDELPLYINADQNRSKMLDDIVKWRFKIGK